MVAQDPNFDLQEIVIAGEARRLGCILRPEAPQTLCGQWRADEDHEVIPRSQWVEASWRHYVPRIMDQDGIGACNAFAACLALETSLAMAGFAVAPLSPGNLYGRINGGRDQGSALGDALETLRVEGVCTETLVKPLDWHPRNWPAGWKAEAAKHRILEFLECPTFDHIASAIQRGFLVDYGILVGRGFAPGADGWVRYERGAGGHALCGVGLARKGDTWGILTANSWSERWGDKGFGIVPESYFRGQFNDAWAVRVATPSDRDSWPTLRS